MKAPYEACLSFTELAPLITMVRRALVTGSSSGIGLAVSRRLIDDGWCVDGLDQQPAVIQHDRFTQHSLDLSNPRDIAQLLRSALLTPPPSAMVHAAGLLSTGALGQLSTEAGDRMWAVHVRAASLLADGLIPAMQRSRWGRVILIGSRVSQGMAGRSQYAATKAALVALARSWAAETAAMGITVNVISPAATDTPMLKDPARNASPPRVPPMGRFIRPDEVASLAAYLISDRADAITGQDISICGGASVRA